MSAAIFYRIRDQRLEWIEILAPDSDRIMKSRRHYSDYGIRPERKQNLPADDVPIGIELPLPGFVSQDDHTGVGGLFFAGKCATEKWTRGQDPKNVGCDSQAFELARFVAGSENRAPARVCKHGLNRLRLIPNVGIIWERSG